MGFVDGVVAGFADGVVPLEQHLQQENPRDQLLLVQERQPGCCSRDHQHLHNMIGLSCRNGHVSDHGPGQLDNLVEQICHLAKFVFKPVCRIIGRRNSTHTTIAGPCHKA